MKYHILHDFRASTPFKENSSDHFKDVHKLKILTKFGCQSDFIAMTRVVIS